MNKKRFVYGLLCVILLSCALILLRPTAIKVQVRDSFGKPVKGASVYLFEVNKYKHDGNNLRLLKKLKTNCFGYVKYKTSLFDPKKINNNISVKVIKKGMSFKVVNISMVNGKRELLINLSKLEQQYDDTKKIRLVNTLSKHVNLKVPIGKISKAENVLMTMHFQKNIKNKIDSFIKEESSGTWSRNGSVIINSDIENTFSSVEATSSCEVLTTYQFLYQHWEIQRFNSNDEWITYKIWEELLPYDLIGGAYQGFIFEDNEHKWCAESDLVVKLDKNNPTALRHIKGKVCFESGFITDFNQFFNGEKLIANNVVDYGEGNLKTEILYSGNDSVIGYDSNDGVIRFIKNE